MTNRKGERFTIEQTILLIIGIIVTILVLSFISTLIFDKGGSILNVFS